MGLSVTAYENVDFDSYMDDNELSDEQRDECYDTMHLLSNGYEPLGQSDGIDTGFYNVGNYSKSFSGAYSGHKHFRSSLTNFLYEVDFGTEPGQFFEFILDEDGDVKRGYKKSPFIELFLFSDCEGFIGPKTSAKLHEDFVSYGVEFKEYLENSEKYIGHAKDMYLEKYNNWLEAFQVASNNGFVDFH